MAFCKHCGTQLQDNTVICPNCGMNQEPVIINQQPPVDDNGGFGWGLLGCCLPVVGLILFLVWRDTKPKTSRAAGIGALVSVIASVVFYIIYFVIILAFGVGAGIMGM